MKREILAPAAMLITLLLTVGAALAAGPGERGGPDNARAPGADSGEWHIPIFGNSITQNMAFETAWSLPTRSGDDPEPRFLAVPIDPRAYPEGTDFRVDYRVFIDSRDGEVEQACLRLRNLDADEVIPGSEICMAGEGGHAGDAEIVLTEPGDYIWEERVDGTQADGEGYRPIVRLHQIRIIATAGGS